MHRCDICTANSNISKTATSMVIGTAALNERATARCRHCRSRLRRMQLNSSFERFLRIERREDKYGLTLGADAFRNVKVPNLCSGARSRNTAGGEAQTRPRHRGCTGRGRGRRHFTVRSNADAVVGGAARRLRRAPFGCQALPIDCFTLCAGEVDTRSTSMLPQLK